MLISDIKPYARNARKNDKAIPAVAESIREFGFKGAITLRSRSDYTIVNGHTRVEACKLLGWSEIPDECIMFADDLTDEQVDALRLADNKTAQIATWNKSLLKSEAKRTGLDMSRFGFDFKSKERQYGAERLRTDRGYNIDIVSNAETCGAFDMPKLEPCRELPSALLPFNYAKSHGGGAEWLHFFIDDYQFERLWANPRKYLSLVKSYGGALSPDFSLYTDMPLPMQQWNEYRRRVLMNYWQRNGVNVIPTLSWTDSRSYGFCFGGIPCGCAVAVSTVGVANDSNAMKIWFDGMEEAMDIVKPSAVIVYGGDIGFEFGCKTIEFGSFFTRW